MTGHAVIEQYQRNAIISAPPERLLIMLYDGALRNLNLSLRKLSAGDRAGFSLNLGRVQAIVGELLNCLDVKAGKEIGKNLERLYLFVIDRLIEANLKCDGTGIQHSIHILKTLKEGWEHAVRQTCGQPA